MNISMPIVWLIAAVAFGVFELVTTNLVSIWFVIGAIVSMLLSFTGIPILAQVIVFVLVSGIVLFLVRPFATKYINSKAVKTNIDAFIGKILVVKKDIDNFQMSGRVDMDGSTWIAVSADGSAIKTGEEVKIVRIDGAKLVVEKLDKE